MATQIPRPVESGQSGTSQNIHNVSSTDAGICLVGNMQNISIGNHQHATIEQKIKNCREALFVTDPGLDRKALIAAKGNRAHGTCEWIVEDPHYKSWLAKKFPVLRISGGPGKGKTMLSLFLTEKLTTICQEQGEHLLFFYCRFQDERLNDTRNVLRNIVYQLLEFCQHDCQQLKQVLKYFETPKKTNDVLSNFEGLWDILETLLSQPGLPTIWCIIDGIDECHSPETLTDKFYPYSSQQEVRNKLQLLILGRELDDSGASHVIKFDVDKKKPDRDDTDNSISSLEPLDQMHILCRNFNTSDEFRIIKLDADHRKRIKSDVECFITSSLEPLEKIEGFLKIRDDITNTLVRKAEGTFLWVSFVIAELRRKKTCFQITDAVKSFPKGLNPTFARMLHGIDPQYRPASASILKWIAFAERPFSLNELAAATTKAAGGRYSKADAETTADMVQLLGPLLQIQENKVFFVHQSAKEYLIKRGQDTELPLDEYRFKPDECHGMIAYRCLEMLKRNYSSSAKGNGCTSDTDCLSLPPLFGYAKKYWDHHTRLSAACTDDITRPFFEKMVLQKEPIVLKGTDTNYPSLHEVSERGIVRLLEALYLHANGYWRKNINLSSSVIWRPGRPLTYAIYGRCDESTIKFLLKHGADSQVSMREAFAEATRSGKSTIIRILLEHGVTCRSTIKERIQDWFWHAIGGPVINSAVTHLGEMNSYHEFFWDRHHTWAINYNLHHTTFLDYAAKHGDTTVVQAVIDHGADIEAKSHRADDSALFTALSKHRLGVLELLLDQGADIEAKDDKGRTALSAVLSDNLLNSYDIVECLVERHANTEATDPHGATPLINAVWNEKTDIARYLIDHGANVNAKDHSNDTALIKAILRGNGKFLEYLLSCGAATHVVADSKRPLVLSAIEHESERILKFLLQKGADINGKASNGVTPLVSALVRCKRPRDFAIWPHFPGSGRRLNIAKERIIAVLFLDLSKDWDRVTPEKLLEKQEEIIKSLLNHGADITGCGRVYLYEPLLSKGTEEWDISRSLEEEIGWVVLEAPPIVCAAICGLEWAINLLLEREADCNARATELYLPKRTMDYRIPHRVQNMELFFKALEAYGSRSLPKHIRTRKAGSALVYASMGGHLSTVRLLLSCGANTSIEDGFGMTALKWARKKGFAQIEEVLKAHDEART